jgi:hypothetical protein
LLVLGLLPLGGCGGGSLPPLEPVKGKVTVDGTPITSGQVSLRPEKVDTEQKTPSSSGQIDAEGNYEIFTGGKRGAPAGTYVVSVSPSMVPPEGAKGRPKAPFSQLYQESSKSPLRLTVPSTEPGAYDLKLKK